MAPRQATALALIMVGAVFVLARVNTFDADSKAAALTTLLLVVQVAHCLALQTRREAALGCAIVVVLLSVGAAFAGDVTLLLPVMVALPAVAVTAALLASRVTDRRCRCHVDRGRRARLSARA